MRVSVAVETRNGKSDDWFRLVANADAHLTPGLRPQESMALIVAHKEMVPLE